MIGCVSVSLALGSTHQKSKLFFVSCVSVKRKMVPIHTEWTSRLGQVLEPDGEPHTNAIRRRRSRYESFDVSAEPWSLEKRFAGKSCRVDDVEGIFGDDGGNLGGVGCFESGQNR